MSRDTGTRIDSTARQKQIHQRLPSSPLWVMTPDAAVSLVRERYGLRRVQEPFYIANGNEQVVLADLIKQGVPVALSGPPGIGKRSLVRSVFHRLNVPLQSMVASPGLALHQLLGRQGVTGGQGEILAWVDGNLSLAARAANGGCVNGFYLDELGKLPTELLPYFFGLIDGRMLAMPTGEEIDSKGNLKLVFSFNPANGEMLDDSLRSRLVAMRLNYPASKVEIAVLRDNRIGGLERFAKGHELANGLVKFANIIRRAHGYEVDLDFPPLSEKETHCLRLLPAPPSTRLLVTAARMITTGSYGSVEAAHLFIIPSLVQDMRDGDLPPLQNLLRQMIEALLPKFESTRQKLTFKDVDTLYEEEHALARQAEEEKQDVPEVDARINRDWIHKH